MLCCLPGYSRSPSLAFCFLVEGTRLVSRLIFIVATEGRQGELLSCRQCWSFTLPISSHDSARLSESSSCHLRCPFIISTIPKPHHPGPSPRFPANAVPPCPLPTFFHLARDCRRVPVSFILVCARKIYPKNSNVGLSSLGCVYAPRAFLFPAVERVVITR